MLNKKKDQFNDRREVNRESSGYTEGDYGRGDREGWIFLYSGKYGKNVLQAECGGGCRLDALNNKSWGVHG